MDSFSLVSIAHSCPHVSRLSVQKTQEQTKTTKPQTNQHTPIRSINHPSLSLTMGERKVLNKYIPPDFDPALVPRGTKLSAKDGTVDVRMMLPFTLQCDNCHTFLYRGRKFNSKKEPMGGAEGKYLGITRWRFYIKCTHCSRPITFLTDPQNADYELESGGTRNYEMKKDQEEHTAAHQAELDQKAAINPMAALESRVVESKKEMADLDNLEEIRAMNARHVKLLHSTTDAVLNRHEKNNKNAEDDGPHDNDADDEQQELTAEDEALVQSIFHSSGAVNNSNNMQQKTQKRRRLNEDDERKLDEERQQRIYELQERQKSSSLPPASLSHKMTVGGKNNIVVLAKRPRQQQPPPPRPSLTPPTGNLLGSLLGGYDSSSSSSSSTNE
jgi:hypothetical protein